MSSLAPSTTVSFDLLRFPSQLDCQQDLDRCLSMSEPRGHDGSGRSQKIWRRPAEQEQLRTNETGSQQRASSDPLGSTDQRLELDEELNRGRGQGRTPITVTHPQNSPGRGRSRKRDVTPTDAPIQTDKQLVKHPPEGNNFDREIGLIDPIMSNPEPVFRELSDDINQPPRKPRVIFKTEPPVEIAMQPKVDNFTRPQSFLDNVELSANLDIQNLGAVPQYPAFLAEKQYIEKRRDENMGLQSKIHEMRRRLREKQYAKSLTDDKFFQRVRKKELGVTSQRTVDEKDGESIIQLMDKYQNARDEYGPLEDDCHRLEDQLYAQEFELRRLETDFYARWIVIPNPSIQQPNIPEFEAPSPAADNVHDQDVDLKYHPRVVKYLSKLGDLDLLQERLDEILDERDQLEDQRDSRKRFGLSLGVQEQTWLDDSTRLQGQVEEEIRNLEIEVEDLKQECISARLMDENGDPTDFKAREQEIFEKEDDLISGSQISEYSKYPILLPQHGVNQDEVSEYDPNPGEKSFSVSGRINSWLLDMLRSSPLDVGLLARTYEGRGGDAGDGWQVAVLKFWYEDGTSTGTTGFQVYTSSMTTQAPPRSENSTKSSDIFDANQVNQHYHVFVRPPLGSHSDRSDGTEIASAVLSSPASTKRIFSWNSQ